MENNSPFCNSLFQYNRFETREVMVGTMGIGGNNPIRIQSMTTTDTMDTKGTVEQAIRVIEAGCEIVRITAPSKKEAENLKNIREELHRRGFKQPLVADIHFTPNAAEIAARIVEKVRINPGNYADRKKFATMEYTDQQYNEELERIRERFLPLVKICKEAGTAMRIGTNHGSLSDRIMNRYGDTPKGMVESALEFTRICRDENFHQIVFSMKASNPQIMIQAYRLLVATMIKEGMNYPLHLGVTEAGDGEDGRIKSAVGIGALLEDGLGDTIRVSLTEEPEAEIPVAKMIAERYAIKRKTQLPAVDVSAYSPFEHQKRLTTRIKNVGGSEVPKVVMDLSHLPMITPAHLKTAGYFYNEKTDKWTIADAAADFIYTGKNNVKFALPGMLSVIMDSNCWSPKPQTYPFLKGTYTNVSDELNFVGCNISDLNESFLQSLPDKSVLVLTAVSDHKMAELRCGLLKLKNQIPVIFKAGYSGISFEQLRLYSSTDFGGVLADGFGDGIWFKAKHDQQLINQTAFGILQATRTRISKTEYISCPSCGRTLFDLQETTARIKEKTDHLKGLKIGVMGCIVNGPGEMADADYGYVGSGVGVISLYKGKDIVRKNIPAKQAVDALVALIKENDDWFEPQQ